MINNCKAEIIPASADATALLAAFSSLALSVSAFGEVLSCDAILALDGASIYAAIAGLAPAKCRLFRLLLAIF